MRLAAIIMIAYLNMTAKITIGELVFTNINSFTVEQSVKDLSDKATIVIARDYKLLDKPILDYIHSGLPVTIQCGYNGDLKTEFEGFVKPGIDVDFPIRLECDQLFPFRKNNWLLSYENANLKNLLQTIAPGYIIECPGLQMGRLVINNASTLEILKDLESKWGLFFKVHHTTLCAGWPFDFKPSFTKENEYTIGLNVRNYRNLKFIQDNDYNTNVNVSFQQTNGKKKIISVGSGDKTIAVKKVFFDEKAATDYANGVLKKSSYDGYFGMVSGYCTPRTNAGDSITIINKLRPERNGTYVTERVVLNYEEARIQRDCHISFKAAV